MMNILRNEKGIALPMVMMLSAILLAVMAALIFMITSRTELSGVQKRYYTAAEAGKGGLELTYLVIDQKMGVDTTITDQTLTAFLNSSNLAYFSPVKSTPSSCTGTTALGQYAGIAQTGLLAKLSTSSSTWSSNCNASANIDPTDSSTYDLKFDFAGTNGRYRAFAKIVGTVEGLVGGGSLMKGGVVGGIGAQAGSHYIYTIEIDAENLDNPAERAKYSVLYLY